MHTMQGTLWPENEAPRAVLADRRGTAKFLVTNNAADNTTALRLQRLRLLGIIGARAEMLTEMAWGEAA
jgi:hypothetical protein